MSSKPEPPALPPAPRRRESSPEPADRAARRRVEGRLAELGELVQRLAASARNPELVDYLARIERSRRALDRMFRDHPLGTGRDAQPGRGGDPQPPAEAGESDDDEGSER